MGNQKFSKSKRDGDGGGEALACEKILKLLRYERVLLAKFSKLHLLMNFQNCNYYVIKETNHKEEQQLN